MATDPRRSSRSARRFALPAAGLIALLALAAAFAAPARTQKAPNPHWKRDTCNTCHTMEDGKAKPIDAKDVDLLCLQCHDGRKAPAEFHPVGRTFDHDKYIRPDHWPIVDSRLACITCHDMLVGCESKGIRAAANPMMLRNYQAGRAQSKPFCQNCHQESAYRKINPHVMLLSEKDEIIEDKCLFCHTRPLDRDARQRTDDPALKAPQPALCKDCHGQHKDPMMQGHIGLTVSDQMHAVMATREVMGLAHNIPRAVVDQAKATRARPEKMICGSDGRVVCTTCHNPHQLGVFPRDSVLSYRAIRLVDGKMTSPVRGEAWCRHCHEF